VTSLQAIPTTAAVPNELTACIQASDLGEVRVCELAAFARDRGQPLVETLVERGGVEEGTFLERLAGALGLGYLREEPEAIAPEVLARVSPGLATSYRVVPLRADAGALCLAVFNPFDWQRWDELSQLLRQKIRPVLCPRGRIQKMLRACYGIGADTVERLLAGQSPAADAFGAAQSTDLSEEAAANEPTVVHLVNQILTEAIRSRATDIHFEPYEDRYRVRYRIDGLLEDVSIPVSLRLLRLAMLSRIKIMSNLDITEKRLPQDGRCHVTLAGQDYDLRVSILPGIHGEAVVIRLQSRSMVRYDLAALGFEPDEQRKVARLIGRPHGLMLVTGPTGSGKTTTLYTCLGRIVTPHVKVITVEDPVEYWMDGVLQMQVHEAIGFDFASALRHMLRHDPDVMLIGEIRDRATADIAIRSALTGHLVLATLHTNDAAGAMPRLIDIGVEPFLVASSVTGVLAQRLIRKVCQHCRQECPMGDLDEFALQAMAEAFPNGRPVRVEGRGCERCRFTGYAERMAVGEVMVANAEVRRMVQERQPAERIKEAAVRQGMRTLRSGALRALGEGKTTLAEVLRVTQDDL